MGQWLHSSTFSWPQNLLEVSGQLYAPAALPPGKSPRYPLNTRLGAPQSRSGRRGDDKIYDPSWTRSPTLFVVQPVASRYTDCAIPAPQFILDLYKWCDSMHLKGTTVQFQYMGQWFPDHIMTEMLSSEFVDMGQSVSSLIKLSLQISLPSELAYSAC
jgi:hypothetical protein